MTDQVDYTCDIIDGWLKRWADLDAQAEAVRSPSHYEICRPAPTRGRASGDSMRWVLVRADLARAQSHLTHGSLAWQVIEHRKSGATLGAIASQLHQRKDDICGAYRSALERMLEYLEPQPVGAE